MKLEEEVVIDINALLEELERYRDISAIYCKELRNSLAPFDLDKIIFCLNRISSWFQEREDTFADNIDYIKTKKIISVVEKMKQKENEKSRNAVPLMHFWVALNTWLKEEAQDPATLYSPKYQECYSDFGRWVTIGSVDNNALYRATYGKSYIEVTEQTISPYAIKEFIEAYYSDVIEPLNGRLKFTIKVNELFVRFKLFYKLQKGKINQVGYKTSYKLEKIENFEQFERKIEYSTEMIMHGDFIDKHCALKYIADAFCYFLSLYKNEKKLGELVNSNTNSNVYKVVKDEINFIKKCINNDFDIRHNEKNASTNNGQLQKREVLDDPAFTEYLYNRINSVLMLFRIKRDQKIKIDGTNECTF